MLRFNKVCGARGTYEGGWTKDSFFLCRGIDVAEDGEAVEVCREGNQTYSSLCDHKCARDSRGPTRSNHRELLHVRTDCVVMINPSVHIVAERSHNSHGCGGSGA